MCREKGPKYRRCPSCEPARRSAYRKAYTAAMAGHPIGAGGTGLGEDAPAFDVAELAAIMGDLAVMCGRSDEYSDEERKGPWLRLGKLGGLEQAVVYAGHMVADEAERRAGITGEQIYQRSLAHRAQVEAQRDEAQAEYERLLAEDEKLRDKLIEEIKGVNEQWSATAREHGRDHPDAQALAHKIDQMTTAAMRRDTSELDAAWMAKLYADQIAADAVHDTAHDEMRALSAAYREVLAEVRPFGGEAVWHSKTTEAAAADFGAACQFYPADWVAAHNRSPYRVLARHSTKRAHYVSLTEKKQRKKVRMTDSRVSEPGDPRPFDTDSLTWRPAAPEERTRLDEDELAAGWTEWIGEYWDTWEHWDPTATPDGKGWERLDKPNGKVVWRRPAHQMETVSSELMAEATTDGGIATATHEMGHRFEHVVPSVGQLEHSFYLRRTTDPNTGEREPLVALFDGEKYRGEREMSRPDSFPDDYMGKDYEDATYHEILTTGIEAIFHGNKAGGLVGVGRHEPDPDTRAFVLGLLAVAPAPKPST